MFKSLHTHAVLAFWSVSVLFNPKEHRFHLTVSHFYQFRNLRSRDIRAVLVVLSVSLSFTHLEHCLYSIIVHLYQFRYLRTQRTQAVLSFWSVSVSFVHLYQLRSVKNWHTQAGFSKLFADLLYTLAGDFYLSLHLNFLYLFIYVRSSQRRGHCNSFSQFLFLLFIGSIFSTQLYFISKSSDL